MKQKIILIIILGTLTLNAQISYVQKCLAPLSNVEPSGDSFIIGEMSLSELHEILSYFIIYPEKLDYIHTLTKKPVEKLIQYRLQLYQEILKGDLKNNLYKIKNIARKYSTELDPHTRKYLSFMYELSLIGISFTEDEIIIPFYLKDNGKQLLYKTPVEVETYPVNANWTYAIGQEEELARYRSIQVTFQMSIGMGLYDIRFQDSQFADDLSALNLKLDYFHNKDILELGSNEGHLGSFLTKNNVSYNRFVGIDWDFEAVCTAQSRAKNEEYYCANNKHLPFSDNSFHTIILNNFLGPLYFKEMKRILKPGGTIIVTGSMIKGGSLMNGIYQFNQSQTLLIRKKRMIVEDIVYAYKKWIKQYPFNDLPFLEEQLLQILKYFKQLRKNGIQASRLEIEKVLNNTIFQEFSFKTRYYELITQLFQSLDKQLGNDQIIKICFNISGIKSNVLQVVEQFLNTTPEEIKKISEEIIHYSIEIDMTPKFDQDNLIEFPLLIKALSISA